MGFCFAFFIIIFREGKMGASAQIRREQKFQSGQIPENAEEQQYRHAAPEQDVFRPEHAAGQQRSAGPCQYQKFLHCRVVV